MELKPTHVLDESLHCVTGHACSSREEEEETQTAENAFAAVHLTSYLLVCSATEYVHVLT